MSIPEAELLDDNMQTYEEFRAQVDREEYGIILEIVNFAEFARVEKPVNQTPKEIQIFPAA